MAEFRVDDLDPRGSEELLKSFFADAAVGLSITDLSGRFVKVNPTYCALTGYTEAELKARDFQSITHPDDLPRTLAKFQSLLSGDTSSFVIEKRYIRKDAIIVWVLNSVSLMRDEQGRPSYVVRLSQDLTEQLQLEESLRQAEVRTESILAHITDVYLLFDHSWRYLYANDAAVRAIGRPREQILGRTLWQVFPDIAGTDLEREYRRAMEERVTVNCDFYYPARGNWWENRFYPVPSGLALFATDITERRRADTLLRQSKNQLVEAQHLAQIGSWHWDLQTNSRSWSEELYRIFGLDPRQPAPSLDTALVESVHPDDRELVKSAVEDSIKSGQPSSFFCRIVRPDGAVRFIHSRGNVIVDESGNPTSMFGTVHDITERRRAEDALREAERKYRDIFENAGEGIFQTTPEGQYIAANPALARMHGFANPEEFISSRQDITREVYVDPARREEFKRLINEQGVVREFEHQIYRKDRSKIWVSVNARAVRDEYGTIRYYEGTTQDITERKRSEEELRESEERFSKAFYSSPAPLIITRLIDGCFLNVNDSFLRTFGYESEEVIGKTVRDLNIYVDHQDRKKLIDKLREQGALRGYESRARTKDGRILDLLVFVEQVKLKGEQCILSTAYDITERKGMEKALRESEERYRELFENAKDALYVHDLSGRYTSFNRAAEQLSGFSRNEIIGKHFSNFVAPASLRSVRENLCKKLDDEGETTYEIDLITKDRRRVPIEVSSRLIYENGEPIGVQGVARDITERKRADEARSRLALIVESSDDAIIGKTLEGTILSWNSGAARIYGYSAREVIGCHVSILVPPDQIDEIPRHLEMIRRGESISHYETLGKRKDGKLINVSLTISPIRDARNQVMGGSTIARDITKSKQAEQALQTFSRRLIEAQEAERKHIARELHDEIGQVLTAVRLNLQSLQGSTPTGIKPPQLDESLGIVDEALEQVRELSLNLRPPVLDNLGLSSALRWYVDRYARSSGLVAELNDDLEDGQRLHLELETACFRIVQEALTNVARHAHATHVLVNLTRSNGTLNLKITDDGVGFDAETLLKESPPAWALGLRGMEERADAVLGKLKIRSAAMRGTEISVSFPLKDEG